MELTMLDSDLFGLEDNGGCEVVLPEAGDAAVLIGWDEYRHAWKRYGDCSDDRTVAERKALTRALAAASAKVIRNPVSSLEAMRAKLIVTLCSGPDGDLFIDRFVHGKRLPTTMPFRDFQTCMIFDVLEGVERLMQLEARVSH
jgi:hypothetical protein